MNKYTRMNWENTPSKATPLTADNLNHMDEGIERATDGAIALETEIATARGDSADLNTRFTADEASLKAVKSEIATARGSYDNLDQRLNGFIVDDEDVITTFNLADGAVTLDKLAADLAKIINNKADKATTLAGYGITDAYTQSQIKAKLEEKLKKMPFDSEPKQESPCYLTSGAVYNALLNKANSSDVKTSVKFLSNAIKSKADINAVNALNEYVERNTAAINGKYDSSNVELGTATLTPYSTLIDKIKSATCLYEKIGDIVIVNVAVIMNETSLGGTSSISLLNMPFSNKSDVIVHDIGISKNGGMFRGSVNKSAWLQFTPLNKQAYNFVADEQVNFSLIYKI